MFTHETAYTATMLAVLTVAVVATLFALAHALSGTQFFW